MNDKIKPAIISNDFNEIAYKVGVVDDYVSWVHLDIMDGKFASPESSLTPLDLIWTQSTLKQDLKLRKKSEKVKLWRYQTKII